MNPIFQRLIAASATRPPITYIGLSQTDTGASNAASVNLSVPAGTLNGDILVACVWASGGSTYTQASFTVASSATSNPSQHVFWRTANSEPSSYTFTWSGNNRLGGVMLAFRNAAFDAAGTVSANQDRPGSITVSNARNVLLYISATTGSGQTFTPPDSTWPSGTNTWIASGLYSGANNPSFAVRHAFNVPTGATPTSSSNANWTGSNNKSSSLLALKPA